MIQNTKFSNLEVLKRTKSLFLKYHNPAPSFFLLFCGCCSLCENEFEWLWQLMLEWSRACLAQWLAGILPDAQISFPTLTIPLNIFGSSATVACTCPWSHMQPAASFFSPSPFLPWRPPGDPDPLPCLFPKSPRPPFPHPLPQAMAPPEFMNPQMPAAVTNSRVSTYAFYTISTTIALALTISCPNTRLWSGGTTSDATVQNGSTLNVEALVEILFFTVVGEWVSEWVGVWVSEWVS